MSAKKSSRTIGQLENTEVNSTQINESLSHHETLFEYHFGEDFESNIAQTSLDISGISIGLITTWVINKYLL